MSISPISSVLQNNPVSNINTLNQNTVTQPDGTSMFADLFDNLVNQVNTTNSAFEGDMVKAAEGELDNPHQLTIDSAKASIALQTVMSVRNNALEAYNDIIKMTV